MVVFLHKYCDRCVMLAAFYKLLCTSFPPPPHPHPLNPLPLYINLYPQHSSTCQSSFLCVCAGTLLVKDGSHSSHEDFFQNATVLSEEQKQKTEDFYKFQDQERDYFQKFENKALSAKAGSLFLWDSRCAHQNLLPGTAGRIHKKNPYMKTTVFGWVSSLHCSA